MIELERRDAVFVLTMDEGENRWNTTFTRAFADVVDELEQAAASGEPAALLTRSTHPKFFSNGLDLEWIMSKEDHPGGDRAPFGDEFMKLMSRIILLPMPTVVAVNGHGFGAGFMLALCHDVRLMRADRGYLCANEIEIGISIPTPELALFRHKMSASAFHETVVLARRWTGPAAQAAGFVESVHEDDVLLDAALDRAAQLAPFGARPDKYAEMKQRIYGENAALDTPHGAAHLLANLDKFS